MLYLLFSISPILKLSKFSMVVQNCQLISLNCAMTLQASTSQWILRRKLLWPCLLLYSVFCISRDELTEVLHFANFFDVFCFCKSIFFPQPERFYGRWARKLRGGNEGKTGLVWSCAVTKQKNHKDKTSKNLVSIVDRPQGRHVLI